MRKRWQSRLGLMLIVLLCGAGAVPTAKADLIKVLYPQGAAHGFVEVTTLEGKRIALGDLTQTVHHGLMTSRLTLRFNDGSLDDDTTVFAQGETFRLVSDRHVQKGPSFPNPSDTVVDARAGTVTVTDEKGKVVARKFKMPPDTYNGMASTMVKIVNASTNETSIAIVIPLSSPRLAHLTLKRMEPIEFKMGEKTLTGQEFLRHVDLGFIAGVIAPLIDKAPADYRVVISEGSVSAFIKREDQLYVGGPIWRIQQISATFPPPPSKTLN